MSNLIVEVCRVDSLRPHPNADRLDVVTIKGWQVVVGKGQFAEGQPVVYFPPDTMLPAALIEQFGVTKYCQPQPDGYLRIRRARLRGEPSFGLVVPLTDEQTDGGWGWGWKPGREVGGFFNAKKYEPPVLGM